MNIRCYTDKDFNEIQKWWLIKTNYQISKDLIPENDSYILEKENEPIYMLSLIKTNTKICFLENFIKNPKYNKNDGSKIIFDFVEEKARLEGFTKILLLPVNKKLVKKYESFGYTITSNNISSLLKEII